MPFELTILGTSSAVPMHNRFPSAQVLQIANQYMLIDCGEGTQIQLNKYKIPKSRIDSILISHLHGDHYFGLVGLITSYNLLGRAKPLHIYAHRGLEEIIQMQLDIAGFVSRYDLIFHDLSETHIETILDNDIFFVESLPLQHRIPCCGFLFTEKPHPRKFLPEKTRQFDLPFEAIPILKSGKDFTNPAGEIIKYTEVTTAGSPQRKYAYLTDTRIAKTLVSKLRQCQLLYHESTFLHADKDRAYNTFHSTAFQAAGFAKKCEVSHLLLGHFSAKYKNPMVLQDEARQVFENTILAKEGMVVSIEESGLKFSHPF